MKLAEEYIRFKQLREELKLTQTEFGERLELNSSTADIERGKTRITGKTTMLLLKLFKVNPLWLFGESEKKYLNPFELNVLPKAITIDKEGRENIILVPAKAAAGYGNNIGDTQYLDRFAAFGVPLPEFRNASFRGFQITGDSMLPLVHSGDWVFAKALNSFDEVLDNAVYIIVESDSIRLKKIKKLEEGKRIELISLNPEYATSTIDAESVLELWEYHSKISFEKNQSEGLSLEKLYDEIRLLREQLEK